MFKSVLTEKYLNVVFFFIVQTIHDVENIIYLINMFRAELFLLDSLFKPFDVLTKN